MKTFLPYLFLVAILITAASMAGYASYQFSQH